MPDVQEDLTSGRRSISITDELVVSDRPTAEALYQVTVNDSTGALGLVQLPNGRPYQHGESALLTAQEFDELNSDLLGADPGLTVVAFGDPQLQGEGTPAGLAIADPGTVVTTQDLEVTVTYMNGGTEVFGVGNTDPSDNGMTFESSDVGVATVNADGTVTGVADGTAVITASFWGLTASFEVTVNVA